MCAGEFGGLCGEGIESSGGGVGGLRRRNYRLSIAMGEGFGETLAREMAERLKNHLSCGRPLQNEEAMLSRVLARGEKQIGAPRTAQIW